MPLSVRIEATSRLHFGLLSFGQPGSRQFGGVGLMVQSPGSVLLAEAAETCSVGGPQATRLREFVQRWRETNAPGTVPGCHLRLIRSAPQHVGLGTGTQLGLSVAAALYRMSNRPLPDAATLAGSVGRGGRSSIGTYGFLQGGLIFDLGKATHEPLGRLGDRVPLPAQWRIVQICPSHRKGLSGPAEKQAFRQLPPVPRRVTDRLLRLVHDDLLPAARSADADAFGEAVYQYGYAAGMCFAASQGGPFASAQLSDWVEALRQRRIRGVGQSSWGPTLFALTPSQDAADELVAWVRRKRTPSGDVQCWVSAIANHGARCLVQTNSVGTC